MLGIIAIGKQFLAQYNQDKIGQLSAAFAYGALFAIGPLLLIIISVAGFIFGDQAVRGTLFSQLTDVMGAETAQTIEDAVAATRQSSSGITAFIIGTAGLLLAAAALTSQMQNTFNVIFSVVPDPKAGLKRTVYVRLKNISLVLLGGLFVAASIVVSTLIFGLGDTINDNLNLPAVTLEVLNNFVSFVILATITYFIYKVLPDVKIPRNMALLAACAVSLLFLLGKILLSVIIANNGAVSAYGAAASLVTLLLWIYYSGQILFIGAEGIKLYATNHDIIFKPKKYNLRRTTIYLDGDSRISRLAQAWDRVFKRK